MRRTAWCGVIDTEEDRSKMVNVYIPEGGRPALQLPAVTVAPELLGLALDIQEARVQAEAEGSLRMRMVNVRTDARSMDERRVR